MILEFPKHIWIQTGSEFDSAILGEILYCAIDTMASILPSLHVGTREYIRFHFSHASLPWEWNCS